VKAVRFLLVLLYAAYMTHMGMLLTVLPWSQAWPHLLLLLPTEAAHTLDLPALRGLISGFGVLHLLALMLELIPPELRRRLIG
jgi:hypothetical protein